MFDLSEFVNPFYERSQGSAVSSGTICVAPALYLLEKAYSIQPLSFDPAQDEHHQYVIKEISIGQIAESNSESQPFPVKDLNLQSKEKLLACKVKLRPVIVLSKPMAVDNLPQRAKFAQTFLCAPCYRLLDAYSRPQPGFSPEFIQEVKHLTYRTVCPLPFHGTMRPEESYLRFDRLQSISAANVRSTDIRLSPKALDYVLAWLDWYLTGNLSKDYAEIRQFALELLAEYRAEPT